MILLDGHSLNQRGLLEPETMALNLAERDSTATVTAGLDILSVSTGDWIKDNEDPGAGIVWRVKTVETQYDTETKTLQLEHLIRSLADKIINEEVTPETIAGEGAVYCSAYAAAEYILDRQSDWVLGDFDYTEVENPYTFDGDTLLAALETVSRSLEDPIWVYDFSSYPFTLHIRRRSENVTSEMRQGRNITTLKATVDRSRMYTRFYPVGKNNLRLDDPGYVAKNENIYGIVEKTETDQSMDTAEKLYAWAQERLNRHCEPQVTITISGADLSAATGESLDSFRIGDQCRVPLPDYGTTISEKIVKLQWRDKIKDRETVTITLANTLEDVQSILQKEKAAGSRGARGGAKMAEENETLIGDVYAGLYTRISQTAYEIRLEAHNEAESMRSIISQTAESIRISVENDRESLRTLIVQTASYIRTEAHNEAESIRSFVVQTASEIRGEVLDEANSLRSLVSQTASEIRGEVVDEAGSIRSLISQTASQIRGEVADEAGSLRSLVSQTASTIRGEVADEANSLRSLVTQTASEWSARIEGVADSEGRVTAASIVVGINKQTGSSYVKIQANKVDLGSYATVSALEAAQATIDNLTGGTVVEGYVGASLVVGTTVTATSQLVYGDDSIFKRAMRWTSGGDEIAKVVATGDTSSIVLNHSHAMSVDSSGNVSIGDAQTTTGTFNIADTAFYKARVASAWNSGGETAKADQQSQYAPYGGSVVVKIQYVNNEGTTVDTGRSVTIWNTDCSHTFDDNRTFTNNGTYYSSTYGFSGFSKVVVNVNTATEEKTITSNGTYTPSSGKIGFSKVVVSVSCGHTFGERTFSSNGTYYPSTYGYSGFSKVVVSVDCGHSFGTKSISSNGTFYASNDGYSGYSSVTVSGVRSTRHNNSVDNLTKSGKYNVLYAPDSSGTTISVKLKNISSSGRVWYYRSSSMDPTTMWTS